MYFRCKRVRVFQVEKKNELKLSQFFAMKHTGGKQKGNIMKRQKKMKKKNVTIHHHLMKMFKHYHCIPQQLHRMNTVKGKGVNEGGKL